LPNIVLVSALVEVRYDLLGPIYSGFRGITSRSNGQFRISSILRGGIWRLRKENRHSGIEPVLGRFSRDLDSIVGDAVREIEQLSNPSRSDQAGTTQLVIADHRNRESLQEP